MPEENAPTYLGDGLYAEFDGFQIRLYASDGQAVLSEVFLDFRVWGMLRAFVNGLDRADFKSPLDGE